MTDTVTDVQSPANIIHQINVNYFLSLVAFTILYHDYALTFGEEVRFVWSKKRGFVAYLFFANRYVSVIGTIPVVLQTFANWSPTGCDSLQKFHQFLSITVQIIVAVIVILRTYALYELNWKVAATMSTVALIVICFAVWAVLARSSTVLEPYDLSSVLGCHPLISHDLALKLSGAWGSLLLFDTVVFVLTLRKAIIIKNLENRRLFYVLIRDGTVYYFLFALINLAQIIIFFIGTPLLRGVCTTFANVVSSTLISRLMLNLQNPQLFRGNAQGRTGVSTLGAFVAPPIGSEDYTSSVSTTTWTASDQSSPSSAYDDHPWSSLDGKRTRGMHRDIELYTISDRETQDIK